MSNYKFHITHYLLAGVFLLFSGTVYADERILDYHSDISVHTDGGMTVTETIRVRAEGNNIRRGIFRDFPTSYRDPLGNHYRVSFNVLDVQRDGSSEPFHTEKRSNGIRLYIGSADRMLATGVHQYRLRYHTTRQLGFFDDFDELYWNVTGNDWMFPIDHASARISLPEPVATADLQTDFYTGYQGSSDKYAESRITSSNGIEFQTNRGLQPRQGLTVSVTWPKGIVREPTLVQDAGYFVNDNGAALVLLIGLLVPLGWYLWSWDRYGRDPRKGVIIPRFKPPAGLTPAGCCYIRNMSFDKQAFSAAVISLGVKGYLEIHEESDDFSLRRKQPPATSKASKGEHALFEELFLNGEHQLELDNENHAVFTNARSALKKALKNEHLGRVFNLNSVYALPAIAITVVAVIIAVNLNGGPAVWISFALLSIILHLSFLLLLRAPTPAGRRIMDEIEGFRMYLDTAEQDRLELMRSPRLTPEVFEMFLPFAFALGVENHWCERFNREFPADAGAAGVYHPGWYVGHHSGLTALSHLGDNFNSSFSSAISSASTAPGSSSGSGGGGFSGGGGGGGGGGGW